MSFSVKMLIKCNYVSRIYRRHLFRLSAAALALRLSCFLKTQLPKVIGLADTACAAETRAVCAAGAYIYYFNFDLIRILSLIVIRYRFR